MRQPVALVYSAAKLIIETIRKFYLTEQLRILCETYPPPPLFYQQVRSRPMYGLCALE